MLYCVVWANICSGPGLDPKGRAFHRSRRVLNCLGLKHTVLCFVVVFYTASYFIQYCEAFSTFKSCFSAMLSALFLF